MTYNKKSRIIIIFSALFLGFLIFGGLYLGDVVGILKAIPPKLYINAEESQTKVAITGTYNWSYGFKRTLADSDHPVNFEYKSDNIVSVTGKQQLVLGTQKLKSDKKYDFTVEEISVYKDKQSIEFESVEPSFINGNLYIQAPPNAGEYIYILRLKYKDRGTVNYGFMVRVNTLTNILENISKYKIPYAEDNKASPWLIDGQGY